MSLNWFSGSSKYYYKDGAREVVTNALRDNHLQTGHNNRIIHNPTIYNEYVLSPGKSDKYSIPSSLKGVPARDDFVPRDADMQRLKSFFTAVPPSSARHQRVFVVYGTEERGRIQLCAEFARSNQDYFSAVFWLDGSSKDALHQSMADAALQLPINQTIQTSGSSETRVNVTHLSREFTWWLSLPDNKKWLLVIDNVNRDWLSNPPDPQAYDYYSYLPKADHGNIIVTTRLQRLRRPQASLNLDFSPERIRLVHAEAQGDEFHYELKLFENDVPDYAILSHVWGPSSKEMSFDVLQSGITPENVSTFYTKLQKLHFCAQQAAKDGLTYFWIDTCCIDKSNSAELTEAINSMFEWYRAAERCYVYMSDVSFYGGTQSMLEDFYKSRWFTRGWTLQELLAPNNVDFFSYEGTYIGTKSTMAHFLSEITGISSQALQGVSLEHYSVEERLGWAKGRHTTRVEDQAYSIQGLFDIHMPIIYGERHKAMNRLLEEIEKSNNPRQLKLARYL